ncbi:FimV family protein [Bordetella holmesii]|uniref:FimV N-terminal domain protein n=2 Tax=Bordetella holmesii TaxID=35814 RepID=A0A158M3X1_9BORD|nr:FimV/HubP family polar landmark protein [Bordetella holmesii]AIT27842.1 fimV domain protein [Bordetella holmesii 44057]EWM40620.1 fimV domain protein [Bordetella holmesii 35009]EWM42048.1 fimV domain protein [Bordetella holmesii 41130]EWM44518.1 fimV domain protein [Bordetella holmesii 70147]AMD46605.1 hypothetical protein H558_14550 [Bordetella holmesii H558]
MSSRHTQHHRFQQSFRKHGLALALAMTLGVTWGGSAQAARLGHARVISAPGEPLRVSVPLVDLSAEEAQSLQVSLADAAAWEQSGLMPPASLATLHLQTQPVTDRTRRDLLLASPQSLQGEAVDILLDLRTGAGQRLVQVTVLVPKGALRVQSAQLGSVSPAAQAPQAGSVKVRQGDTLYNIARRNKVSGANLHQMLVALWRTNPDAFIDGNMNRIKAGATLSLPDAQTVRSIDPEEARRHYVDQVDSYARYRAGLGKAATGARVSSGSASSGVVSRSDMPAGARTESGQDRLRLSGATANSTSDAGGDRSSSDARALADARERVDTLQSNVDALKHAGAGRDSASDGTVGAAGMAAGAAAAALAGARPSANDTAAEDMSASSLVPAGASDKGGAAGLSAPAALGSTAAEPSPAAGAAGASSVAPKGQGASGIVSPETKNTAAPDGAASKAVAGNDAAKSGLPAWLANNLLVIVTAILALLVLAIAWALRRAGARRDEDNEETPYSEAPRLDQEALNKRLDSISLDLDPPPSDEPPPTSRT